MAIYNIHSFLHFFLFFLLFKQCMYYIIPDLGYFELFSMFIVSCISCIYVCEYCLYIYVYIYIYIYIYNIHAFHTSLSNVKSFSAPYPMLHSVPSSRSLRLTPCFTQCRQVVLCALPHASLSAPCFLRTLHLLFPFTKVHVAIILS